MNGTILTDLGRAKIASASPELPVEITHFAVGDGNGGYPLLTPSMTTLTNEVYRLPSSAPIRDPEDAAQLIFEIVIPSTAGGWTIREMGIFDSEGDLIAIGQTNAIEKPDNVTIVGFTLTCRLFIKLGSADQVSLILSDTGVTDHQGLANRSATDAHPASSISITALPNFSGATQVQEVLAALGTAAKLNSGTGGGLDADTLDGQEGAHYLAAENLTGTIPAERLPSISSDGQFVKPIKSIALFQVDGGLVTSQEFGVFINDVFVSYPAASVVSLPALLSASDYKIYAISSGAIVAQAWEDTEPANSKWIGGFHTAYSNGAVVDNSLWDLGWRPSCNPRAMTLSPDRRVWVDIYLADTAYGLNGYSRPDATIADGTSPPIVPAIYGGNGATTYGSLTWFEAWDLAINAGKRLPFWGEFTGFAFGVVEQQSVGTDPVTTKHQLGHRSACGVEQATGAMWIWGADVQGNVGGGWQAITDGRGSVYNSGVSAVLLGAVWVDGSNSGSRAADWHNSPSASSNIVGCRAVCEHMIL